MHVYRLQCHHPSSRPLLASTFIYLSAGSFTASANGWLALAVERYCATRTCVDEVVSHRESEYSNIHDTCQLPHSFSGSLGETVTPRPDSGPSESMRGISAQLQHHCLKPFAQLANENRSDHTKVFSDPAAGCCRIEFWTRSTYLKMCTLHMAKCTVASICSIALRDSGVCLSGPIL